MSARESLGKIDNVADLVMRDDDIPPKLQPCYAFQAPHSLLERDAKLRPRLDAEEQWGCPGA
jgi:hypothetical protein